MAREKFNASELSNMADCATPTSDESYGGKFLLGVQDDTEYHLDNGGDPDDVHEIADSAPHTYTYEKMQEFVDLGAWREDLDDLGGMRSCENMEQAVGLALYLIASRLAYALIEKWTEADNDKEDEDE